MNEPNSRLDELMIERVFQDAAIQHDPGESFDKSVLREITLDRHARTDKFWMPAIVSALVAGVAVLSAVEVICFAPVRNSPNLRGQEARVQASPTIPDFREPLGPIERR